MHNRNIFQERKVASSQELGLKCLAKLRKTSTFTSRLETENVNTQTKFDARDKSITPLNRPKSLRVVGNQVLEPAIIINQLPDSVRLQQSLNII